MVKHVRFENEMIEPKETKRCRKCHHRNITPHTRPISKCIHCNKEYCNSCM